MNLENKFEKLSTIDNDLNIDLFNEEESFNELEEDIKDEKPKKKEKKQCHDNSNNKHDNSIYERSLIHSNENNFDDYMTNCTFNIKESNRYDLENDENSLLKNNQKIDNVLKNIDTELKEFNNEINKLDRAKKEYKDKLNSLQRKNNRLQDIADHLTKKTIDVCNKVDKELDTEFCNGESKKFWEKKDYVGLYEDDVNKINDKFYSHRLSKKDFEMHKFELLNILRFLERNIPEISNVSDKRELLKIKKRIENIDKLIKNLDKNPLEREDSEEESSDDEGL